MDQTCQLDEYSEVEVGKTLKLPKILKTNQWKGPRPQTSTREGKKRQ